MLFCYGFYSASFYIISSLQIIFLKQGLIMKKIIFSLLICSFLSCQENRPHGNQYNLPELTRNNFLIGNLNENRLSYRVSYYDINIDFDIENQSLSGFVTIKAKSLIDLNKLQIDLAENLNIEKITYKDKNLSFARDFDAVLIDFSETINKDKVFNFTVHYNGVPQSADNPPWAGGFTWSKDKENRDWIAVSCEGEGARIWWPNKDHITAEGDSVRMVYTVPSNMVAVGNGKLKSIKNVGNKTSYEWFVNNPINNYNVSVQIGNYVAVQDTLIKDGTTYEMNHYVLDYNEELATNYFKQSKEVIRFYEKYFGDYQWYEDGYKLVEVPYLGMEHQSAVTYGNDFSFDDIFDRQINALVNENDLVIGISTSGKSKNVLKALESAKKHNAKTIILTGSQKVNSDNIDFEFNVPSYTTSRIQEMHLVLYHLICKLIDNSFDS